MDQEDRVMGIDGKPLYTNAEECIRYDILVWFYKDVCEMALIAMRDFRMQSEDFAVVCIENCDRWEDLADSLMAVGYADPDGQVDLSEACADENPGSLREGLTGLFAVYPETIADIIEEVPDQAESLNAPVSPGMVRVIMLNETGCSVYHINPASQKRH
jgi:hypothetical protein